MDIEMKIICSSTFLQLRIESKLNTTNHEKVKNFANRKIISLISALRELKKFRPITDSRIYHLRKELSYWNRFKRFLQTRERDFVRFNEYDNFCRNITLHE